MAKLTAKKQISVGGWAFFLGVIIAVLLGLFPQISTGITGAYVTSLLIALGLIVGFMNVTAKETMNFILAGVALVIVPAFGGNVLQNVEVIGSYLGSIMANIIIFVAPAVLIVALKSIFTMASDR